MTTVEAPTPKTYEKYRVRVEQYRLFREQGFLVIKGLIPPEDVREMNDYMDDMLAGCRTLITLTTILNVFNNILFL